MKGDFSRRTFDPRDGYRSVLLQQGRVLLDADVNEQADITAHHDEVRTADIVGRSGGPAPDSGPGSFAVTAADGSAPTATAWSDLRVAAGTYYVDGILCESAVDITPADQPHLPAIGSGATASPGLPEPGAARVALYLDVWTRLVTAEEDPSLLEVALGGPDTGVRAQTVWQVRAEPFTGACADLHDPGWLDRTPRPMVAGLKTPSGTPDPCDITQSGGYQRLENQLYRVEIHDSAVPTFLWSRDNGSVFAGLTAIDDPTASGATLGLDRAGRDEAGSIAAGDLVEVSSTDMHLRGQRGYLARAGTPEVVADSGGTDTAVTLPVTWLDPSHRPGALATLGRAPLVRRWDGGPTQLRVGAVDLEGGITVRFPNTGTPRTGDYWLIPARSVRMVYGMAQSSGTIEWPPGGKGPVQQPPVGPTHHVAPLAILVKDGAGWTLEDDCRRLFPPLTALISLDLVGGDGQEAMPGDALPEPVRVAVRNGGMPVVGAPVAFSTTGGHVSASVPTAGDPGATTASTGPDGVAGIRWLLDPVGPATQTLTISRLDDADDPVGTAIVVTGRLSVAREVAWDAPSRCKPLDSRTVQDALTGLALARELRLLGGDGQEVGAEGRCVPQPVRVVVDSPCGPVPDVEVHARDDSGLVAAATPGQPTPATLAPGAGPHAVAETADDGSAAFWWQPGFGDTRSATLDVLLDGSPVAPIRVSATLDPGGGRTPGVHIVAVEFGSGRPFGNDTTVHPDQLASGIVVTLDGEVPPEALSGKPVVRVELDLPWPVKGDGDAWSQVPVGFRTVTLAAELKGDGRRFVWAPGDRTSAWFRDMLWGVLANAQWSDPLLGRFIVEGWAIPTADPPELAVNGHAATRMRGVRTVLVLPTDDDVAGGVFTQWFRLSRERVNPPPRPVPDVIGRTAALARRVLEGEGLAVQFAEERDPAVRKGLVIRTEPAAGTDVAEGSVVTVVVSTGRG
jgi:hypothetical protein